MARQPASPPSGVDAQRKGRTEARVFTPPLRDLTPATTRGFELIEFARDILEVPLLPWQEWLALHALETLPDGTYRFRTVVLMIARQSGKSTFLMILALWRMYADGAPLVIGTAQNLDIAEELWTAAYELAESIPELAELIDHVDKTNGKKALRLTSGERYKVAAASRRGGRGLSGDLVLMDELREHQSWDAWGAVTKTTMARRMAQVWAASNAGDSASVVLRYLRSLAHEALGFPDGKAGLDGKAAAPDDGEDGTDESLGIFEWSADPKRALSDRDGWAEANPSLGYTITEKAIAAAARTDPEWVFRPEVLCQWVSTTGTGPFPEQSWAKTTVEKVKRDTARPVAYCVDVSHDRTMAYVAIAFWDVEGRRRVEIAARRAGTDWVIPWLLSPDRRVRPEHLTLQWNGAPVSSLVTELEQVENPPWGELVPWRGPDLARASGLMYDAMRTATAEHEDDRRVVLTHGPQPALDVAATSAVVKPLGDGWVIDRKNSPQDASPLVAALGADWLLNTNPTTARSAYEDEAAFVL